MIFFKNPPVEGNVLKLRPRIPSLMQDGLLLRYDSGADPGLLLLPPVRVHQGGGLAAQPQGPRPLQPQARGTHICRLYQCFGSGFNWVSGSGSRQAKIYPS